MLEVNFLNPLSKTVLCDHFGLGSNLLIKGVYRGDDPVLVGSLVYEESIPSSSEGFDLMDEEVRPSS